MLARMVAVVAIAQVATACSDDRSGFVADPRLDCIDGEAQVDLPPAVDTDAVGAPTALDAIQPFLESGIGVAGPGLIWGLSGSEYSVRVDDRLVLIATANETRPGEWHLASVAYCEA